MDETAQIKRPDRSKAARGSSAMKHAILGIALLAVASPVLGGEALAAEHGSWYFGADMGRSMFSAPPSTPYTFASIRAPGEINVLELRSLGIRAYGGFRVNRYFALEAGYADLGTVTFAKSERPCLPAPGMGCLAVITTATAGEIAAQGWNLSARATFPIGERLELMGKLGVLRSTATLRATETPFTPNPPVFFLERTITRTSSLFGIGMGYRISPGLSFTLDWEQSKVGSADTTGEMSLKLLSAGVRFDF